MKKLLFVFLLFTTVACNNSKDKVESETIDLKDLKTKISYSLGADQARAIVQSNDPNFEKYNVSKMVEFFKLGHKLENAFDEDCAIALQKLFDPKIQITDTSIFSKASECYGKISGYVFYQSWSRKKALNRLDMDVVALGFKHGLENNYTQISKDEQQQIVQSFIEDINKYNGSELIENAKNKPNSKISTNGVVVETLLEGKGSSPLDTDDVLAHYILMNTNGDTIQNSIEMYTKYGQDLSPFSLAGGVILGWKDALPMTKVGGKYKIYIPYHMGYGERGVFNQQNNMYDIEPFESLIFYIEPLATGKAGTIKPLKAK